MSDSADVHLTPLELFAAALVDAGGTLSGIHQHMHEFRAGGHGAPDAPPIMEVMRTLIADVLGSKAAFGDDGAVETAAHLVLAASEAIASEVYLVAPPEPLDRPLNRQQRRARRCG
jgi:hypothetical protein